MAARLLLKILDLSKKHIPVDELSSNLFKLIVAHFKKSFAKLDEATMEEFFTLIKRLHDDQDFRNNKEFKKLYDGVSGVVKKGKKKNAELIAVWKKVMKTRKVQSEKHLGH
jgi:hypothetical protein